MTMRSTSFGSLRGWHLWVSIALALPIFIVSLTAIFIAHDKSLKLKSIEVPGWLAPASGGSGKSMEAEWRSHVTTAHGVQWLGGKMGLYSIDPQGRTAEVAGPDEVRDMAPTATGGLLIAAKNGLWHAHDTRHAVPADLLKAGDFWTVQVNGKAWMAIGKDLPPLWSQDQGRSWQDWPLAKKVAQQAEAHLASQHALHGNGKPLTADKLVMDWHTGKAILGKRYEWIWIDLIGASMALLTITGLLMWWRGQRRKAKALAATSETAAMGVSEQTHATQGA